MSLVIPLSNICSFIAYFYYARCEKTVAAAFMIYKVCHSHFIVVGFKGRAYLFLPPPNAI